MKVKKNGKIKYSIKDKISNFFELYDDLFFTKIVENKNSSDFLRDFEKERHKMNIDFLGSYDKNKVAYYYYISNFPRGLFIDWKERIRRECRNNVRVNFIQKDVRHSIDWNAPHMESRLRILKEVRDETQNQNISAYNMHNVYGDLAQQKWIEDSLMYLSSADEGRDRKMFKNTILMIVVGERGEDFDRSVASIEKYTKHIGIHIERVICEIPETLSHLSPFKRAYEKDLVNAIPTQTLTDEIIARFNSYSQGKIGSADTWFGTDIYSNFPALKKVKLKSDSAENWLISAETEGGKSFFVKMLILQLIAQGFNGTIMDFEGFEYIPIANYLSHNSSVEVINLGEGQGKYFDPVAIPKLTGIDKIDREGKRIATNFTLARLKVLTGKAYDENVWIDTVLNDAVTETYRDYNVTEDMETWKNSKNLRMHNIYYKIKELEHFRETDDYTKAVKQCIAILGKYFEKDGTRASIMQERVKTEEVNHSNLVLCSFGMAGKDENSVDPVQIASMQLSAAQLSYQRSIYSYAQGKYNFKVWEELNRWGDFSGAGSILSTSITGGRKLGDVNIGITNKLGDLLKDDKFSFIENATSFLIGAVNDEKVREEFCKRKSIPLMKEELDKIAKAHKTRNEKENSGVVHESFYQYSFICGLDRAQYGTVKMKLPKSVSSSKLFKTGVEKQERKG